MGISQDPPGSASTQKNLAVAKPSVRNVEGIVKDYLALVAKDYIGNDVTESYRIVKKKRLKRSDEVRVDLSHCKYEVLRTVIRKMGWQEALDERPSHLYWTDTSIGPDRLMTLKRGQKEGLVRFCTMKYMKPTRDNLRHSCMHLTNYSLNKFSPNFEYSDTEMDKGSKWSLSGLYRALAARGHDTKKLKQQIKKMVVMTFIAIAPYLTHNYTTCLNEDDNGRSCFEVLGLDVLIDDKCRPWLLEVNHSPSFSIDTPLDLKVKEALLSDTLALIHLDPSGLSRLSMAERKNSKLRLYGKDRKDENFEEQKEVKLTAKEMEKYEAEHIGNFDLIHPCTEDENLQKLYDICLAGAQEAFKHSFDMKVKKAIEKVQEDRKQEALEKEMEEKKKLKQRAQMRKKAQESARLVALSRHHSDVTETEEGPPKSSRLEAEDDEGVELVLQKWHACSPRESPRKDVKLSPRCLPALPCKKVAWENTLRNDSPYGNSGFIRPQIGLLPPIRQVLGHVDSFSQTSPRLKFMDTGKQAKQDKELGTNTDDFSFWQTDGSTANGGKTDEDSGATTSTSSPSKRSTTKLPEVKYRNRSISPVNTNVQALRTLPTARFIFEEPVLNSSRTEPPRAPDSVTKWFPKLQINEMVKALKNKEKSTSLHVCHICKPMKRIPRYEACRSRRSLREFLAAPPAEVLGCKPVEPSWKSSEALLPPKERVLNAFVTQADPNRFLTLAKTFNRA